ncbi:alkaline phosphatase D family protein [Marinobacter fonticola]|uniref:alkaline phosphatase D family protein n=1 Tax=Marinobacter fonticola TaxID=2603215 RepID=UPI0011E6DBB8|nr:alkaline phosphatase D family protein [Marinobacter fonticola]
MQSDQYKNDAPAYGHPSTGGVLVGPLLRRASAGHLVFWLVAMRPLDIELWLFEGETAQPSRRHALSQANCRVLPIGTRAFVHCLDVKLDQPLPEDELIGYDLRILNPSSNQEEGIADWAPHLLYEGQTHPAFVVRSAVTHLLHGSCRRPHHPAKDGMARADRWLAQRWRSAESRPSLMLLTGDQIYADDVAGPMLRAIHGVIQHLGLFEEDLSEACVGDSRELLRDSNTYYGREHMLPETDYNEALMERFFGGVRKPIFSTANAKNHTVTVAEVLAMYLLVWSPVPWAFADLPEPELDDEHRRIYRREQRCIDRFAEQLPAVARLLAQVPSYMIFDDHDVTDDWNLSALWEETVYGHPFSRRIVGNALIAYLICQGWGNEPEHMAELMDKAAELFQTRRREDDIDKLDAELQDAFIDQLVHYDRWGYVLDTQPRIIVLDTRTRRWRSEVRRRRPSGLMDWEALTELQQDILHQSSAIIVSPTPVFGVKLIEGIQAVFSWVGKPLLVDAENWMAHRGAANVILNIFGHARTPQNFVLLSGDVHYSFVYDVSLRHKPGPKIWQITSSGLKNEFPHKLLDLLDRLNRWLYAPWSPLNWFTKRRRMRVSPWYPENRDAGERLWNAAGMGYVQFNSEGRPVNIVQLNATDTDTIFRREDSD